MTSLETLCRLIDNWQTGRAMDDHAYAQMVRSAFPESDVQDRAIAAVDGRLAADALLRAFDIEAFKMAAAEHAKALRGYAANREIIAVDSVTRLSAAASFLDGEGE